MKRHRMAFLPGSLRLLLVNQQRERERDADGARVVAIDVMDELHERLAILRLLF